MGDIQGIREDFLQFYDDLAADVAEAHQLLHADVLHGRQRATEVFAKIAPYELASRSCRSFDQKKLEDALQEFYHGLYHAYRSEIRTSAQRRAFGLAFPVTVDRSRVGTASINAAVERFQSTLDSATIRDDTNGE